MVEPQISAVVASIRLPFNLEFINITGKNYITKRIVAQDTKFIAFLAFCAIIQKNKYTLEVNTNGRKQDSAEK